MKRLECLDGLRGLLAVYVLLGHMAPFAPLPAWFQGAVSHGGAAVDVFFILSGLVIAQSLERFAGQPGRFLIARAARIFPVYLPVLAVAVVLEPWTCGFERMPWIGPGNAARTICVMAWPHQWGAEIAAHLSMTHGLFPNAVLPDVWVSFLGAAWSLSAEWQFYVLALGVAVWTWRSGGGGHDSSQSRLQRNQPVCRIRGEEIAPAAAAPADLRQAASDYYDTMLRNGLPVTTVLGVVTFARRGRNKLIAFSAFEDKLRILPAVRHILEAGAHPGREDLSHDRSDGIIAFHRFSGLVAFNGETRRVAVLVYQDKHGHKFYDLDARRGGAGNLTHTMSREDTTLKGELIARSGLAATRERIACWADRFKLVRRLRRKQRLPAERLKVSSASAPPLQPYLTPLLIALMALAVTGTVWSLSVPEAWQFSRAFLPNKAHFFALGVASVAVAQRRDRAIPVYLLVMIASLALCGLQENPGKLLPPLAWTVCLAAQMQPDRRGLSGIAKLLCSRLAQWLGSISYCVYLVNEPIHKAIASGLSAIAAGDGLLFGLMWIPAAFSLPIAVSAWLHVRLEKPAQRWGRAARAKRSG